MQAETSPHDGEDVDGPRKPPSPEGPDEIFAEEKERQAKHDAEVAASWSKKVFVAGKGREAWQGARATVHIVGHRSHEDGDIFEDSRSREEPQLLLLGRGSVVLGLDRALLAMREGEHALITVAPEGGYGAAGSHTYPIVPGSCTLVYDVEVLRLEDEGDLWDQALGLTQPQPQPRPQHQHQHQHQPEPAPSSWPLNLTPILTPDP